MIDLPAYTIIIMDIRLTSIPAECVRMILTIKPIIHLQVEEHIQIVQNQNMKSQ